MKIRPTTYNLELNEDEIMMIYNALCMYNSETRQSPTPDISDKLLDVAYNLEQEIFENCIKENISCAF